MTTADYTEESREHIAAIREMLPKITQLLRHCEGELPIARYMKTDAVMAANLEDALIRLSAVQEILEDAAKNEPLPQGEVSSE